MKTPSILELWKTLDAAEREQACRDFLTAKETDQDECNRAYARFARVRVSFWSRKSVEERAKNLAPVLHNDEFRSNRADVIQTYLLRSKEKLLSDFLNALEIPHKNGRFEGGSAPTPEKLCEATISIRKDHPFKDCWLYLGFLVARGVDGIWKNLPHAYGPVHQEFILVNAAAPPSTLPPLVTPAAAALAPTPNPIPDLPDDFSALDELVIKSIVATASGTEGALTRQRIDDLVDEIVSLNGDRRRSYFHRGFFHALFDVSFEFSFAAENHERRSWYMAGVLMGLLRQGTGQSEAGGGTRYVDDVIRAQRGIVEELALDGKLGCGPLVARSIYPHLIAVGETSLAARMAEVQGRRLSDAKRLALMNNILADGSRFLREGKLGEAQLLLQEALRGLSHTAKIAEGDPGYETALRQALRKMGQCHQALGNFTEARSFLQMVVELRDCEERREALTDLGLITAGFKSLRSIIPGKDPLGWPILTMSLSAGKVIFEQAIESKDGGEVRGVRNAHLALGLSSILARPPNAKASVDHLERAYAGMLRRREAYESGNVLDWTRFLLALAHLEQLDPAFAAKARELTEESIEVGDQFPIQLWQRCLDAAAVLDDATLCQRIVEYLFERRAGEVFTAIRGSSALLKSELLRRRYNEMLVDDKRLSIVERFAEWKALLRICQQEGDSELAAEILGQLEEFALKETPLCGEFEALLASPNGYSPGWDSEDAEMSRARVLENMGRLPEAATIYARWFYALTEKGSEHCVAQAREFLEKAKKLGGEVGLADMESRLAACEDALNVVETNTGAEAELKKGAKVRLLYVGGNEIQEAFDEKIAQRLTADYPGLKVEFYHPGWSSNWNRSLDDVKRLIPEAEAILLSPLVRTQFGRNLRKFCNAAHPWFASTAKGQSGIRESIRRLAIATLARRSPCQS